MEKKNSKWIKFGDLATFEMPSGLEHQFDFNALGHEAIFAYYGKKQWLADKGASSKDTPDEDRLALMVQAYNEACEKGVELTDTGKISVIGKERANAKPRNQDSIVLAGFSTYTDEEVAALKTSIKLGLVKVSAEVQEKINNR
jgi:hypothetical protein